MINIQEKKEKIMSFLKATGPSLPVRVAKAVSVEPFLASALLSELLSERKLIMSHMKVGKSSLYLIEGQEVQLENYAQDFKSGEKDAYLKLKESKVLIDEGEEPAIRVALRGLKDFAIPFKYNDKIMWRYAFTPESEIREILEEEKSFEKEEESLDEEEEVLIREEEPVKEEEESLDEEEEAEEILSGKEDKVEKKKVEQIFEKKKEMEAPKPEVEVPKPEMEIPKPGFFTEVIDFLKSEKIEFLEEIQTEKKEVVAKVSIRSDLGRISFLLIAKNKKTLTKEELAASIQRATYSKMPCLLIIRKEPTKAIKSILEENSLIKIKVMED